MYVLFILKTIQVNVIKKHGCYSRKKVWIKTYFNNYKFKIFFDPRYSNNIILKITFLISIILIKITLCNNQTIINFIKSRYYKL